MKSCWWCDRSSQECLLCRKESGELVGWQSARTEGHSCWLALPFTPAIYILDKKFSSFPAFSVPKTFAVSVK